SLSFSQRYISKNYQSRKLNIHRNSPTALDKNEYFSTLGVLLFIDELFEVEKFQTKIELFVKGNSVKLGTEECYDYKASPIKLTTIEDGIIGGYPRKLMTLSCIPGSASKSVATLEKMVDKSRAQDKRIFEKNMLRIKQFADFLGSKGDTQLVLVVPPLTEEYYQTEFIQKQIQKHFRAVEKLSSYKNIKVLDFHNYLSSSTVNNKNEYFHDADHLALSGAIKFSKAIKSDLGL
ncbi:MAG: hypothetical protein OQJ89_09695, partial [Kangiellaceae bacterium]|nr:hypothetical protein [Kangiellaceae bacterium]